VIVYLPHITPSLGTVDDMLRAGATLCTLAACAFFAVPSAHAGGPDDTFPEVRSEVGPNTRLAMEAVGRGTAEVRRRWPRCDDDSPGEPGRLVDGPIPTDLAGSLGVLRRAQTPEEAALAGSRTDDLMPFAPGDVLTSSLRIVRTLADGRQVRVFIARDAPRPAPRRAVCRARELREVRSRARDLPPQARRAALRLIRAIHESERAVAVAPPESGVYLATTGTTSTSGPTLAGSSLDRLRSAGLWSVVERDEHTLLVGLMPDGVARVEVVLARGRSPFSERAYPTAQRVSGAVVDNVVAIPVQRAPSDAWMTRQVWRAPDGSEIPVARPRQEFVIFTPES
jgi:hypothetical protein